MLSPGRHTGPGSRCRGGTLVSTKNPFWTAGALEDKAYIERDSDTRIRRELADNQRFLFLYGPRNSGTTSTIRACLDRLSPGQYCCTRIDVSKLPHTSYAMFMAALLETVANEIASDKAAISTDAPEETILAWLKTFPQRLVIFLDEIQAIGKLPFRDQVLGKLRFFFNMRGENRDYDRLQVVLSGAAHPDRLMPSVLAAPFAGGLIPMQPLGSKQVEKLAWDLESAAGQVDLLVGSAVYQQTRGLLHLCQIVLHHLWEEASRTKTPVDTNGVGRVVDRLVQSAEQSLHFAAIYQAITEEDARLDGFLSYVRGTIPDAGLLKDLLMTGLCSPDSPYACPVYERVFGIGGPLDLSQARGRSPRATVKVATNELVPSARTPEVHIELPSEARREHSMLSRLKDAAMAVAEKSSAEAEPLPEPPRGPMLDPQAEQTRPMAFANVSSMEVLKIGAPSSRDIEEMFAKAMSSEDLTAETAVSAQLAKAEEESTWVDGPKGPGKAGQIDAGSLPSASSLPQTPATPLGAAEAVAAVGKGQAQEIRERLDQKLMLSAELDSFCATFFPRVAQRFVPGMARMDKINLLVEQVPAADIGKRLREWSSRLDVRDDLLDANRPGVAPQPARMDPVVIPKPMLTTQVGFGTTNRSLAKPEPASEASAPAAPSTPQPVSAPSAPSAPSAASAVPLPPVPIEVQAPQRSGPESASFAAAGNALQVGVGLVLANRYFLTSEIGRGPVGTVWNAYDRIKDEQVALKLIYGPAAEKPAVLEAFWRGANQIAALSHPALIAVLNKPREENDIHYLVLEYLAGGNLRQWVLGGKLSRGHILRVLQRLGAGLQYAHERRVFHRNIKPTNVVFDATGNARLSDLGLSWPQDSGESTEQRADRILYMAPEEQLGAGGDARSDLYSLGMCALFAIYGKELPSKVMEDRPAFIESLDLNVAWKTVLKRATAGNPADRFASAADFCRALDFDAPMLPGISLRMSLPPEISRVERTAALDDKPSAARPAPLLASHNGATHPPPLPDAPSHLPAPPLSGSTGAGPGGPPPPPLSMPPLLFSEVRPPEREEPSDISPTMGRSAKGVAEYRVETERVQAVASGGVLQPVPAEPRFPMRRSSPVWLVAGVLGLVVVGGGTGYWLGNRKTGGETPDSNVAANSGRELVPNRPLRLEPLTQKPTPVVEKPVEAPIKEASEPKVPPVPVLVKAEPTKATPVLPPSEKVPDKANLLAQNTATPKVAPTGEQAKPGVPVPVVTPPKPVLLAKVDTKPAPITAPVPVVTAPKVVPKVAVVKPAPTPIVRAKTPLVTAPKVPQPPVTRPVPVVTATKPIPPPPPTSGPSADELMKEAQAAFVRGQHAAAISTAMQVTSRGGAEAIRAWRFVGGAACSSGQAGLATNAYNHLRDPEHRRLLVDLCRRNNLPFTGNHFSSDE